MDLNFKHLQRLRDSELDVVIPLLPETGRILEIGAGAGWQAKRLSGLGYQVEAIDLTSSNYHKSQIWPVTDYDGVNIPFPDRHFDVVYSSNVLEHVQNLPGLLDAMRRVLIPGGKAIHLVPSSSWRLWTSLCHYPYIIKYAWMRFGSRQSAALPCSATDGGSEMYGWLHQVRRAVWPTRHGETGTCLTEIYSFSRLGWKQIFQKSGWRIQKRVSNNLFYTGYQLLGDALPLDPVRRQLSRILGGSCHVFVLEPLK